METNLGNIAGQETFEIKGLAKYLFVRTENGIVPWSKRTRQFRRKQNMARAHSDSYVLSDDNGRYSTVSTHVLMFLIRNPGLDYTLIGNRLRLALSLTKDGYVKSEMDFKMNKRYTTFRSLEDALETVLLLMQLRDEGNAILYTYAQKSKPKALYAVASVLHTTFNKVERYWDDGVEDFVRAAGEYNVQKIAPIFVVLCRSLKNIVLRHKDDKEYKETRLWCQGEENKAMKRAAIETY